MSYTLRHWRGWKWTLKELEVSVPQHWEESDAGTQSILNVTSRLFSFHMPTAISCSLSRSMCAWDSVFGEGGTGWGTDRLRNKVIILFLCKQSWHIGLGYPESKMTLICRQVHLFFVFSEDWFKSMLTHSSYRGFSSRPLTEEKQPIKGAFVIMLASGSFQSITLLRKCHKLLNSAPRFSRAIFA